MDRGGRPKKDIDWDILNSIICTGMASLDYCCERQLVKEGRVVSKKTIESMRKHIQRKIQEKHDCTFTEYREKKMEGIRVSIVAKQMEVALKGDRTLLIWLGKNKCNQADKIEERIEVTQREWTIGWGDEVQAESNNSNSSAEKT
jgi:hypothetical protein